MNKLKIVQFADVCANLGKVTLTFKEGLVAVRLLLWTMEQMDVTGGNLVPEDVEAECDRLIKEESCRQVA